MKFYPRAFRVCSVIFDFVTLFRQAITAASHQMETPDSPAEKSGWVLKKGGMLELFHYKRNRIQFGFFWLPLVRLLLIRYQ